MIFTFPEFAPPVKELFALANTTFEPAVFRAACESFSQKDDNYSFDDLWYFSFPNSEMRAAIGEHPPVDHAVGLQVEPFAWRTFAIETDTQARLIVSNDVETLESQRGRTRFLPVKVRAAVLSICWWDSFDEVDADSWHAESALFDHIYTVGNFVN